MAFITGKTLQGNCGAVNYTGDGHYTCGPIPDLPGVDPRAVDHINFYAKILGKPGEEVHLDIQWPIFSEELCGWRKYKAIPFFTAAHRCVYTSNDELEWHRIEDVQVDAENWILHIKLTLTEPVCYVSVNYYYTCRMFESLREAMAQASWVEEKTIGLSRDGQELYVYKVTDPTVPISEKKIVYLQGGQHCCEYGGMHLLDAVLRYLTGGTEEVKVLLRKYEFHIMPIVSVADWAAGYKDELAEDSNTVWDTLCTPETRAIDAYLRDLPKKPEVSIDFHNARNNFLIAAAYVSEEKINEQKRFEALVVKYCDYTAPGKTQWPEYEKYANFKQYAIKNFGFGLTAELSRFSLYSREQQKEIPLSRDSFTRFGMQLPHTIDAFLSGEQA